MKSIILTCIILTGCAYSSMTTLKIAKPLKSNCSVELFADKQEAEKGGDIQAYCVVNAYPSPGWDKTLTAAIENGKEDICECGVNKAYIKNSSQQSFNYSASVTLIGFKYKE